MQLDQAVIFQSQKLVGGYKDAIVAYIILQSYNFAANLSLAVSAPLLHSPSPTTCGVIWWRRVDRILINYSMTWFLTPQAQKPSQAKGWHLRC